VTDEVGDTVTNPRAIFEVTSPSTVGYDYSRKFELYRTLRSIEEYVLVAHNEPRVDVFRRMASGRWELTEYSGFDVTVAVESLGIEIPMREIYDRVPGIVIP